VPQSLDFREIANVRYLEDVFLPMSEIRDVPGPQLDAATVVLAARSG
jgi:hypothetical protein